MKEGKGKNPNERPPLAVRSRSTLGLVFGDLRNLNPLTASVKRKQSPLVRGINIENKPKQNTRANYHWRPSCPVMLANKKPSRARHEVIQANKKLWSKKTTKLRAEKGKRASSMLLLNPTIQNCVQSMITRKTCLPMTFYLPCLRQSDKVKSSVYREWGILWRKKLIVTTYCPEPTAGRPLLWGLYS